MQALNESSILGKSKQSKYSSLDNKSLQLRTEGNVDLKSSSNSYMLPVLRSNEDKMKKYRQNKKEFVSKQENKRFMNPKSNRKNMIGNITSNNLNNSYEEDNK